MIAVQVGEVWGYRETNEPGTVLVPVEVVELASPKTKRVRVRFLDEEHPGLDRWVPRVRLKVPWSRAEAWLRDEVGTDAAVRQEGRVPDDEIAAVGLAFRGFPGAGGPGIATPLDPNRPVFLAEDLSGTAGALGLDPAALLAEPHAFVDSRGNYVAPWAVAVRIARRVAETFPDRVLAVVAKEERSLRTKATQGDVVRSGPYDRTHTYVEPDHYADVLRELQPVFDAVRAWCGADPVERWDEATELRTEVARLRAEVDRLRAVIRQTAEALKANGSHIRARTLLAELGEALPPGRQPQ